MKKIAAILFLAALALSPQVHAQTAPAADPKVVAETAREVAQLMPLEKQMQEMSDAIAETLVPAKRPLFVSILKKNVDIPALRVAAQQALVKTYTLEELRTMKEMYEQPGSETVIAKMDQFSAAMQPTIDAMVNKAVAESRKAGLFPPTQ